MSSPRHRLRASDAQRWRACAPPALAALQSRPFCSLSASVHPPPCAQFPQFLPQSPTFSHISASNRSSPHSTLFAPNLAVPQDFSQGRHQFGSISCCLNSGIGPLAEWYCEIKPFSLNCILMFLE